MSDSIEDEAINLESLSDEDFMKIDPSDIQEVVDEPEDNSNSSESEDQDTNKEPSGDNTSEGETLGTDTENDSDTLEDAPSDDIIVEDTETSEEKPTEDDKQEIPEDIENNEESNDTDSESEIKTGEEIKSKDEKPDDTKVELPEDDNIKIATAFYDKITAPFKADGKEMTIRSPEDAIRLMQMGVNYSRRMEEIKPLRVQDQMLKEQGLDSPEKLNFLIDLSKGKPEAIKKLLKEYSIDPVDIDTSTESTYQATDYQGDPKDIAFSDAIQTTLNAEGGNELIQDINDNWDDQSKEALRDQPAIFQNVLAQQQSGVYSRVNKELEYQRTMGYLTNIPFLQAYHEVGEAMQKAGVFDSDNAEVNTKDQPTQATPKVAPIGTGTRKVVNKPNIKQPTLNISSATPPRSTSSKDGGSQNEPDYSNMSDEAFLQMAPPD